MGNKLTERQRNILEFIRSVVEENGYPPTFREIGKRFGIKSTNGVNATLKALEKKGYLRRHSKLSRGIELLRSTLPSTKRFPVVGKVAAGEPLLAEQNIESEIVVDDSLFSGENVFALRVAMNSHAELLRAQRHATAKDQSLL